MKITEFKNEDAIEVLADLIEPAAEIFSDTKIRGMIGNGNRMAIAKHLLKEHKTSILEILARLNGFEDPSEYTCNPVTILVDVIQLMSDKDLVDFFTSQARAMQQTSSISPAENTEAEEQ